MPKSYHTSSSLSEGLSLPATGIDTTIRGAVPYLGQHEWNTVAPWPLATWFSLDGEITNFSETSGFGDRNIQGVHVSPSASYSTNTTLDLQRGITSSLNYTSIATLLDITHNVGQAEIITRVSEHLRPYLLEMRQNSPSYRPELCRSPTSAAPMQTWSSLMSMILANHLASPRNIVEVISKVDEYELCRHLKLLFERASPLENAVASKILFAATEIGAINLLRHGLKYGAAVDSRCSESRFFRSSRTLLQIALGFDQVAAAQYLIENGADVNISSTEKYWAQCDKEYFHIREIQCSCQWIGYSSPIGIAARSRRCCELIPSLLEKGAKLPNLPLITWAIGNYAPLEVLKCLIRAGSDVNLCSHDKQKDFHPMTHPLDEAASGGRTEVAKLLLEEGADPNGVLALEFSHVTSVQEDCLRSFCENLRSPLCYAAESSTSKHRKESLDVAQLLLEHGADPNASVFDLFNIDFDISVDLFPDGYKDDYHYYETSEFYPIQAAVGSGDADLVNLFLEHNASLKPKYGTPVLTMAVCKAQFHIVELLLQQGASPDDSGLQQKGISPLVAAILRQDLEMVNRLFLAGANATLASVNDRFSPLQAAGVVGNRTIVDRLFQQGASLAVDGTNASRSMLKSFVVHGYHDYLEQALANGVNANTCSEGGSPPLFTAVTEADLVSIQLLLRAGADLHAYACAADQSYDGFLRSVEDIITYTSVVLSPIQLAAAFGHLDVILFLWEKGARIDQKASSENGMMALHLAVCMNQMDMVRFILSKGFDINAISYTRLTYPYWYEIASECVYITPLEAALLSRNVAMAQFLLKNGADPNHLMKTHHVEMVRPLDYACAEIHGNLETVQALLIAGADVGSGDPLKSIIDSNSSKQKREVIELLILCGTTLRDPFEDDNTLLLVAIKEGDISWAHQLLKAGVPVNGRSKVFDGCTALQVAVGKGSVQLIELLLALGADVNAPPHNKRSYATPLQAAAEMGHVELVERLLDLGADVNAAPLSNWGATALQTAASSGYLKIAQTLLDHGADICAPAAEEGGHTAIQRATQFGRFHMVRLLLDRYCGPRPFKLQVEAYEAAVKNNQWHIVEMLESYQWPHKM